MFRSYVVDVKEKIEKNGKIKLIQAGELVRNEIVGKKLRGTRTGRKYRVPYTNVYYTASAAGEPPATATGTLRGSIEYDSDEKLSRVGTPLEYGKHLELGTSKMAARPFIKPSIVDTQEQIKAIFQQRWF